MVTTRERAILGLRMIAALEEYVAGEVDGPGRFGEIAEVLRLSAADRREAAAELCVPPPSPPSPVRHLRLV